MRSGLELPHARRRSDRQEASVPRATKSDPDETISAGGFEGQYTRMAGGYTAAFETYTETVDAAEFFRGLPDDRCQCPHWGYVLNGRITFRFADGDEVYSAGEAYYAPPGHTPICHADTELLEFSPTEA